MLAIQGQAVQLPSPGPRLKEEPPLTGGGHGLEAEPSWSQPLPSVDTTPGPSWSEPPLDSTNGFALDDGPGTDIAHARKKKKPDFSAPDGSPGKMSGTETKASTSPTAVYEGVIANLRKAGVRKLMFGEKHENSENIRVKVATMKGGIKGGALTLYVEAPGYMSRKGNHRKEEMLGALAPSPDRDRWYGDFALDHLVIGQEEEDTTLKREASFVRKAIADNKMSVKVLDFAEPGHKDMTRFLRESGFSISSTGLAHAVGRLVALNGVEVPACMLLPAVASPGWAGEAFATTLPVELGSPPLTPAEQRDQYDGFRRAEQQGLTALVVQNQLFESLCERGAFHKHFLDDGTHVILEVRLGTEGLNATIVAPISALAAMQKVASKYGDEVSLITRKDGVPEKSRHDDL